MTNKLCAAFIAAILLWQVPALAGPGEAGPVFTDDFDSLFTVFWWSDLWAKEKDKVTLKHFRGQGPDGSRCLVVESSSVRDWNYQRRKMVEVSGGEVFTIAGDVKTEGESEAALGVAVYNRHQELIDWHYGKAQAVSGDGRGWQRVASSFVVPDDGAFLRLRIAGEKAGVVKVDNVSLTREPRVIRREALEESYTLENELLKVDFRTREKRFYILDKRTGEVWESSPAAGMDILSVAASPQKMVKQLVAPRTFTLLNVTMQFGARPEELEFMIDGDADTAVTEFDYPPFLAVRADDRIVTGLPGERVFDRHTYEEMPEVMACGEEYPHAFMGVFSPEGGGWMEVIGTPDDFQFKRIRPPDMFLNQWRGVDGRLGYAREVRYIFFERCDASTIVERYREYEQD